MSDRLRLVHGTGVGLAGMLVLISIPAVAADLAVWIKSQKVYTQEFDSDLGEYVPVDQSLWHVLDDPSPEWAKAAYRTAEVCDNLSLAEQAEIEKVLLAFVDLGLFAAEDLDYPVPCERPDYLHQGRYHFGPDRKFILNKHHQFRMTWDVQDPHYMYVLVDDKDAAVPTYAQATTSTWVVQTDGLRDQDPSWEIYLNHTVAWGDGFPSSVKETYINWDNERVFLADVAAHELMHVFGADHVYRMDVRQMVEFHRANRAEHHSSPGKHR